MSWEYTTAEGRKEAERLVASLWEQQNPNLLLQHVRQIVDRGTITALEVGFFYYLAMKLIAGR